MQPFEIRPPRGTLQPVLISVPHCGTAFPEELKASFLPEVIERPDDTDWFVHDLYSFAAEMGVTLIHANYSRYVIDLNRDPQNKNLYDDGRVQFGLVPSQSFSLRKLYRGPEPDAAEIERRKEKYYHPYHRKIEELLRDLRKRFAHVLFFDAHSIRHQVSAVQKDPFPDLILGTQDGKTADERLIGAAEDVLSRGPYTFSHNHPFKGGYLTRHFGRPEKNIHALQLEMVQKIYMDEETAVYEPGKAPEVQKLLRRLFEKLTGTLREMNA